MEKFDIRRFNEYRENNRLEVKKQKAVFLIAFGRPILLWQTVTGALLF